jgi:hypothetical protein
MCISIITKLYRYGLKGITDTCNIPNIHTAMSFESELGKNTFTLFMNVIMANISITPSMNVAMTQICHECCPDKSFVHKVHYGGSMSYN